MKRKLQKFLLYAGDIMAFIPLFSFIISYRLFAKKNLKKNRIFLGTVANNNLVYVRDALISLGSKAKIVPWLIPKNEENHIDYDINLREKFPKLHTNFIGQLFLTYYFFIWAVVHFDVFVMPFKSRLLDRTTILTWFEFQLLHLAEKRIILNPYGADIHYPEAWKTSKDKTREILFKAWTSDPYYSQFTEKKVLPNIRYCEKHADSIIASLEWPDYLNKIDHLFHMRIIPPLLSNNKQITPQSTNSKILKIIHATNHPHFKGTDIIQKAINEINNEEKKIDFTILEKVSNAEVLKEISAADIVFDQLLAGAYGRLALEAMALGKPVICYLREDLKELYPHWNESSIVEANIDNIKDILLKLLEMSQSERNKIGQTSKAYVNRYHSPEYVGNKLNQIIQGVL